MVLMHIVPLFMIVIFAAIGCLICTIGCFVADTYGQRTSKTVANITYPILIAAVVWAALVCNMPSEVIETTTHEIANVHFKESGLTLQVFLCDDKLHNVQEVFKQMPDTNEWQVVRHKYKQGYLGVSFADRSFKREEFHLQRKTERNEQ